MASFNTFSLRYYNGNEAGPSVSGSVQLALKRLLFIALPLVHFIVPNHAEPPQLLIWYKNV
jgi:hypothetical protein